MKEKPFEVGQEYIDNDPRSHGRRVEIIEIGSPYVHVKNVTTGRKSRTFIRSFHSDGKARKTGYTLVEKSNGKEEK